MQYSINYVHLLHEMLSFTPTLSRARQKREQEHSADHAFLRLSTHFHKTQRFRLENMHLIAKNPIPTLSAKKYLDNHLIIDISVVAVKLLKAKLFR